jgi:nucleoside-diphosphate-sugar epimerase
MTRRVLLTGARGFIGRQIMRSLQSRNIEVVPVRRNIGAPQPKKANVGDAAIDTEDLFSESDEWLDAACRDIDTIIHAAWYVEPGKYLQSDRNVDCLIGTLKLAQAAVRAGVKRFVGLGTCLEYEVSERPLGVDSPLRPKTPYAAAKASVYMILSQFLPARNVGFAWCRVFYLHGENEDAQRLVPYVRSRLATGQPVDLTSGRQIRDYLDVKEAGKMIVEVAMGPENGAFNICSGIPTTIKQLVEHIADEYNARHLLNFGARPDNPDDPACIWGKQR